MTGSSTWSDFTRENYRRLLNLALDKYTIRPVKKWRDDNATAIWRHDVDYSPQAALALAIIENNAEVEATYYFNLRSEFYNLFEQDVANIVKAIGGLGHEVGLHFDGQIYDLSSEQTLCEALRIEIAAFESLLSEKVRSFSFHNPNEETNLYKQHEYAGLINAYSTGLFEKFSYCSDSNGYWRFTPLEDFLNEGHSAVCVLTHPNWWQAIPLCPRDRIVRAVEGRSSATLKRYDEQLTKYGRKNMDS